MFDIGFGEMLLVGVVALIVLGPERLPHAARMAGAWVGKIRRSFLALQQEIEREVTASEIKERIQKEAEKAGLGDIQAALQETVSEAEQLGNAFHADDKSTSPNQNSEHDNDSKTPSTPSHTNS